MEMLRNEVNGRGWRRMPPAELEDLVLAIRRHAATQHLTASQWAVVDQMRSRLVRLQREGVR
jgi:hypothetical protein